MELGKIHFFENAPEQDQRDFIQAHNHCLLCGSVLELQHIRTGESIEIQEEARCTQCDIKTRAKKYPLH